MNTTTITRRRAVKYRAYPTKGQANLIDRTIGCARLVYNLMLETRIASYQSRFGMPDAQGKEPPPTPRLYKDDYPFLIDVDSMALCNAQMHLDKAIPQLLRQPQVRLPEIQEQAPLPPDLHDQLHQEQHPIRERRHPTQTTQGRTHQGSPAQAHTRRLETQKRHRRALPIRQVRGHCPVRVRDPSTRTRTSQHLRRIGLFVA